ncbi:hypothetical protein CBS101457_001374 [Exobasidium rhododendri]|nr:hypothetical protein CBS101457_001374 [Exobasidium rhododendri]
MKHYVAKAALGLALAASAVHGDVERKTFEPTTITAPFLEQFTPDWESRWTPSSATKEQTGGEVFSYVGKWSVEEPTVFPGLIGDAGLVAKSKAAQHAISAPFAKAVDAKAAALEGKPLVIQYEVKLQNSLSCGGAYMKLLTEGADGIQAKEFSDKTPYTIMFGPDKCGSTNKVHFIFRHTNPVSGEIEEKHVKYAPYAKISKLSTLYTLIVRPDNTFDIMINNDSKKNGTLLETFEPAVNPEKEIDDPEDKKPADWVETARIPDESAVKPNDWDEDASAEIPDAAAIMPEGWLETEPLTVSDPEAVKPEEWEDEEDGEWIAPTVPNPKCSEAPGCGPWTRPTIRNPEYKGKWSAPLIDNPAYKGEWAPKKIANPSYFEDKNPNYFSKIAGIGFEIWTMDEDILFDNIYVGHSIEDARQLARETFEEKLAIEQNLEKKDEDAKKIEDDKAVEGPYGLELMKQKLFNFAEAAKVDPLGAVKENPSVAALIGAAVMGLIGLVGFIGGVAGSGSKPVSTTAIPKPAKKIDGPSSLTAKSTAVAPKEDVKKRSKVTTAKDEDDE